MAQRPTNQGPRDEDGPPHPADRPEHGGQVATRDSGPQHPAGNGGGMVIREGTAPPMQMAPIIGQATQATQVQMAAEIASVQAMVLAAKAHRRYMPSVMDDVMVACDQPFMAQAAFYEYSRGDGRIKGITVQLAREMLRCFGNAKSGIIELQRVPPTGTEPGRSEMMAFAWDLQTNVHMSTTFWVDHTRDRSAAKGGPIVLDAGRDIYENNANMASRRERAMIERLLPAWLMEMAKERCMQTLQGDAATLPQRIETCVQKFEAELGVGLDVLEGRVGRPREVWGGPDLANLLVIFRSIQRGETTREEAFADNTAPTAAKATDAALAGGQSPPPAGQGATTTPEPGTAPPPTGDDPTAEQAAAQLRDQALREIRAAFRQAKLGGNSRADAEARQRVVAMLAREDQTTDRPVPIKSATDLDATQAARVAQRLSQHLGDATRDPHEALTALALEAATWDAPEGGSGGEG